MAKLSASIAKVGSTTLLSRVLGFVRDLLIARLFGADGATDAFFVAFKVPNLLRRLFAEGAFAMALVPVLQQYREARSATDLKDFLDRAAGSLAVLLFAVTALGVLAAPVLVLLFAPGFAADASTHDLAAAMLRLTLPYLFFIGLTAFAGGILNTYERFGVPAFTPVLLNLVLIGCALGVAPHLPEPVMALAWGVLLAGMVQLAFQLPFLARLGLLPRPRLGFHDEGVRRIGRLMGPALFGVSVGQLALLIDTLLASFLTSGSISWLYYSDRLVEFPLGILGTALGTVILPRLAQRSGASTRAEFSRTLDWALRWVLLLGVPASLGLMLLAGPVLATLFLSGEFGTRDLLMARQSLVAYAFGLMGFLAVKALAPGYYGRQDMRTPVRIALLAMLVNLALSLALMFPFGHGGLALATSIAALLNGALLLVGLLRARVYRPEPGWTALLLRALAANLAMGGALWWLAGPLSGWVAADGSGRVLRLIVLIGAGGLVYGSTLLLLGLRLRHVREPHVPEGHAGRDNAAPAAANGNARL
ncbi:MAG: murein biosynthesis integral membrane protein MurJ [Thiohalocapsa sp.]|uniref:murein biosynthesis integral membrane protein MurJ n=1 Tax=Thiohalocapsa sp. TaxID=2497641 RepID=UPI0025EEBA50|nr:murein biosynthesis integral membrane protein MurJ [Thiohalocapsa sp.]MCG6942766.1 murein biosynthesis integral membrane protein MurJ [Thiohalocapsa sp.]